MVKPWLYYTSFNEKYHLSSTSYTLGKLILNGSSLGNQPLYALTRFRRFELFKILKLSNNFEFNNKLLIVSIKSRSCAVSTSLPVITEFTHMKCRKPSPLTLARIAPRLLALDSSTAFIIKGVLKLTRPLSCTIFTTKRLLKLT